MIATVVRMALAVALATALGVRGYRKKSLDRSGALAAFIVGVCSFASGYRFGLLLIGFYLSGSKLTKVKASAKQKIDANYKVGGQRSARQVLACSIVASPLAVFYALSFANSDAAVIDFKEAPLQSALLTAYVGHYACCAADTWASELGVLSAEAPVLITTLRRVPRGTNGGVSLEGTLASVAGGAFIGALYYAASIVTGSSQVHVITLGAVTGLLGSLLDSLLGATLQLTVYDPDRHQICDEHASISKSNGSVDPSSQRISGMAVLTNEQVNAVSVLLTTALSPLVAGALFN